MNTETELEQAAAEPQALDGWTQRPNAKKDDWERLEVAEDASCSISQYEGSNAYCWHAWRGEARLHDIAYGRLAAMKRAEEIMALPVEEFNQKAVAGLIDDLREIEGRIMRLSPSVAVLPGYHAGYEAGVADIKRRIAAAIDSDEAQA